MFYKKEEELKLLKINKNDKSPAFLFHDELMHGYDNFDHDLFLNNGKIYIFGLPRSGNNWVMNLIADCLDATAKKHVFFTHCCLTQKHLKNKSIFRVVSLIRDIRDVIVSAYHFIPKAPKWKSSPASKFRNIEQFYFDFFIKTFIKLPPWFDWINYYNNLTNLSVPVLHYEKLYDDTQGQLEWLFDYWDIKISSEKISSILEYNTIDYYQKGQKKSLNDRPKEHFRKGSYGNYVNELTPSIIKDIEKRFGDYLENWGYSLNYLEKKSN